MLVRQTNANQQVESVYNLIPRSELRASKPVRYQSNFQHNIRETLKQGKHEHRTMGYAEEPVHNPQDFLRKTSQDSKQIVSNPPKHRSSSQDRLLRKPRDAPKIADRTEKNFVQSNALDIVMSVAKKPERTIVDNRYGDKFSIDPSGLTPKYILKKDFSEVPIYIKTRRADMEKAKQEHETYASDYFHRRAMREMNDNERQTIIDSLKKQWEDVHDEYQTLSVIIDTIPNRQYKENLEYQMKLLEKDLDLLKKHQVIYIAD